MISATPNSLVNLSKLRDHYSELFDDLNGYGISDLAKKNFGSKDRALTYGEVNFDGFKNLLEPLNLEPGGTFYDLGSGTGKAVILAALFGNFNKVRGIELLPELYLASQKVLAHYLTKIHPELPLKHRQTEIEFIAGDMFKQNYQDADVIFIQSTCFNEWLMKKMGKKLNQLKPGSKIISITYKMEHPSIIVTEKQSHAFGWGQATVFYQQKI